MAADVQSIVEKALEKGGGILSLEPAWVARDFLPPGRRLGLKDSEYDVGERGYICERWLASVTKADNRVGPPDEGLSYVSLDGGARVTLREAVEAAPEAIMGAEYARTHKGLGRLAKVYDFGARLPYHIHQMEADARKLGHNSKEEAYYFPEGVDLGPHPETYFGVHPYIVDEKKFDILLPYLKDWDSDLILQHSRAYLNVPGDGFHLPSGILHAPGTAVTIELQEDSDVFAMLQALNAGKIISKELLFKDVTKEDRERLGERAILEQLDWEANGDPYFYENHHTGARLIEGSRQEGGEEYWIYYNTTKFSGKKLLVRPGHRYRTVDKGVYNILVWQGKGRYDGHPVEAGNFERDELLVSHARAAQPLEVENTGSEDLMIIKFFGPDINLDVPYIEKHKPRA
ncbi:MAG: hypothetical protein JW820_15145 [Spirochaetales bacterium]|nr:hypothetical protein [Spirochaetales bacterium]